MTHPPADRDPDHVPGDAGSADAAPTDPTPSLLVVSNAAAGSNDEQAVETAVDVWREAGCDVRVVATRDMDELAEVVAGTDRVVVAAGGDGSIHAVVQALHDTDRLDEVVVGLLPLGTGNDLARGLGIPREPEQAARALLDGMPRPMALVVDQDGTIGVNAVNLGIGAAASERAAQLKEGLGPAAYPLGAIAAGATEEGWDLEVRVDGEVVAPGERVLHVVVGNGPSLGGGTPAAPEADPEEPRVEVMVATATGPAARVAYAKALRGGTHVDREDVHVVRGTHVVIEGDEHPWNVDGELPAPRTRSEWTLRAGAWHLRHPGAGPDEDLEAERG
jgi:YegS/Rv2252/BmrU family lipid kinase